MTDIPHGSEHIFERDGVRWKLWSSAPDRWSDAGGGLFDTEYLTSQGWSYVGPAAAAT